MNYLDAQSLSDMHGCGPLPEVHELTREPFVDFEVNAERDFMTRRCLPPTRPTQDWIEVDDNGAVVASGRHSDAEYAELLKHFEVAEKNWHKTGGLVVSAGRTRLDAKLTTPSGAYVRLIASPGVSWVSTEHGFWGRAR